MSNLTHPNLNDPDESIPSSAQIVAVIAEDPADTELFVATAAERKRLYRMGGILLAVGVIALGISVGAAGVMMPVRVVVGIIGLMGIYMGTRRLGLARIGPDFDLTYVLSCAWLIILVTAAIIAPTTQESEKTRGTLMPTE